MLNLLLWLINIQTQIVDKLIKFQDRNNPSVVDTDPEIEYFCWCISDRHEIVGTPVVISASHPQDAALKYYTKYVPESVKIASYNTGRTLTSLSRPVGN
jgi:hypothetical protein